MNNNTLVAIAIIAMTLAIHGCSSCERSRNSDRHELDMEKLRIEHAEKEAAK